MFKRNSKSSAPSSKQAQALVADVNKITVERPSAKNGRNSAASEAASKKADKKRRSTLGSRVSVHSLLFPAAYSSVSSKDVRQTMSRSVNDLVQQTTVSSDQSGDSSSDRDSIVNTPSAKTKLKECPLCFIRQPSTNFPQLTCCTHQSCHSCLVQYLQMEILESRVHVTCPECSEMLHPNDIYRLLIEHPHLVEKYEEFSVRRVLMTDPDTRWCPAPDCSYAVIASGCAACPELKCNRPGCNTLFCYHCKMTWHPSQTCNEARAQRGSFAASPIHIDTTIRPGDIKACPRCQTYIVKMNDGSCNHMICALCGAEFCWLCLKEISDLHYLSPSGCTFWGKKPWSRKKKLLWQLGMLVGAPVGIALVAGLAVPAIMFGVPVWIGRKVHQKLKDSTKTKRRVAIATSVVGSILLGPVLATMAVGVGVPIMLAYVYGVVPLSLCRNGSCGVTASPSGVRLDLDADLLAMSGMLDSVPLHEKTQLLSSVDKNDASTVASLRSGSTTTQHKMQVHAEVMYTKRRPSIESGAISLGERINYEDASVKALAGSTYYDDKSVHTMGSLAEGGSYCEDQASTKALAGSVICPIMLNNNNNNADTKSLCGAKSVCSGITTGGLFLGDNASVKGLAGSICSGVEPQPTMSYVTAPTSSTVCAKCNKPVHHVTLQVFDSMATSGSEMVGNGLHEECLSWQNENGRKESADSKNNFLTTTAGLESRIRKFADQLSLDSYEMPSMSAVQCHVDGDDSESNFLLSGVEKSKNMTEKLTLPPVLRKFDVPVTSGAARHLSAINEVRTCRKSVDDRDECFCEDDSGEVMLLQEECRLKIDDGESAAPSWKFLKKSRSWSAKLDNGRAAPLEHNQQQPSVHHYKKHSSSWKFKFSRNAPVDQTLLEPRSSKLSNSYISLPDMNQQKKRSSGEWSKSSNCGNGERRTPLATALANFFKTS